MSDFSEHPDGWWQDPDPASAYAKYTRMHGSETNRAKIAVTENLLSQYDWQGKSVLEYGCGGGHFTIWMAKRGANVQAIELNSNAIGVVTYGAAQAGVSDRVHVVQGNAENDTVAGQYDFVFAKDLVEHLDDDAPFFQRIGEQLKPGGRVYVATQNDHCLNYLIEGTWERRIRGNKDWRGWDRTHRRFYNAESLTAKLRAVGIEPERWGSSYLVPWRFVTRRLTGKARPWGGWSRLDQALGTKPPFARWGWSIMVIGQRL